MNPLGDYKANVSHVIARSDFDVCDEAILRPSWRLLAALARGASVVGKSALLAMK